VQDASAFGQPGLTMLQADPIERQDAGLPARFGFRERRFALQVAIERFRLLRARSARIQSVLLDHDPRNVVERIGIAVLLYIAAVLGREALHLLMPEYTVRYLTFFPALLASGLLCGLLPSIALLTAFSFTGFFWIEPTTPAAPLIIHFALTLTFAIAGAGVVIPAVYGINAHRRLVRQDEYLGVINNELHHRLKNLLSVISSICINSLKHGSSQEEIFRNITGRIHAVASAQDFLSITNQGSDLRDLVQAVVGPLCPAPARIQIRGTAAALPADMTTSFALVLHELSTNAIKYGAWKSDCAGTVEIAWGSESDRLWFTWREEGVQVSTIPQRRGFGSRIFQTNIGGTKIDHNLYPDGAECMITMKVPA
jgi:two-component sensor histidine kinase